jgi:hypothetical protein
MPFKSQAQLSKFMELQKQGKISPKTFNRWLKETPAPGKLPGHVKKKSLTKRKSYG